MHIQAEGEGRGYGRSYGEGNDRRLSRDPRSVSVLPEAMSLSHFIERETEAYGGWKSQVLTVVWVCLTLTSKRGKREAGRRLW